MSAARFLSTPRGAAALAAVLAGWFLLAGPGLPILLWDESRTIVNALEMHAFSLVTTFGGAPDLWNTKPPLVIWAMRGALDAFGPSLWVLRLPSLLAAMGTVALVAGFVRRMSGSTAIALLTAALLVLSPGFSGEHATRTADYDAPLTFFTTLYVLALFAAVHRVRPSRRALTLAAVGIAGALMTKSVAGLVPGIGVAIYAGAVGRMPRPWRTPGYLLVGTVAILPLAAFAMLREAAAPGWIAAAWRNDIAGRLSASLIGAQKPATFYLDLLWQGWFAATPILLLAPVALVVARGRQRLALLFAGTTAASIIAVFSLAASKLSHYALPALPFLAMVTALTLQALVVAARRRSRGIGIVTLVALATPIAIGAVNGIGGRFATPGLRAGTGEAASQYGTLLPRVVLTTMRPITVADPGFVLEGRPGYAPVLDAYRLLWRARGVRIGQVATIGQAPAAGIIASCDAATARRLAAFGADIGGVAGCTAIRWR